MLPLRSTLLKLRGAAQRRIAEFRADGVDSAVEDVVVLRFREKAELSGIVSGAGEVAGSHANEADLAVERELLEQRRRGVHDVVIALRRTIQSRPLRMDFEFLVTKLRKDMGTVTSIPELKFED